MKIKNSFSVFNRCIITLVLVLILIFAIAACDNTDGEAEETSIATTAASVESSEESTTEATRLKVHTKQPTEATTTEVTLPDGGKLGPGVGEEVYWETT